MNSRFRLPLIPLYIILASLALDYLSQHFRNAWRNWRTMLVAVSAVALTFAPVYNISPKVSTQDLHSKGLLLYNRGDFPAALACYRAAASIDESFPETNLNIGAALLKMGQVDSAAAYFEKEVTLHPDRAKGFANLAAVELVRGQFDSARTLAQSSLSLRPYVPSAWVLLLRASANDSALGIDSLREIASRATESSKNSRWVCLEAGAALEQRSDLDVAASMYLKGIRASDPPIETDDRLFEQGYEQSVAKDQKDKARVNMAYGSLLGRRGDNAQSAIYSSAAIEIDSSLSGAWINLITALANLGQNTDAATALHRALQLFPDDPVIQRMSGLIAQ